MRYHSTRRAIALLVLVGLLAACGGTSGQPGAEQAATPAAGATTPAVGATAPAAAATAPAGGAAGPKLNSNVAGTVEFWHFWSSPVRRNAIRRIIALCAQQLPNIKVNETPKPFGDIWTANVAAVSAGSGMPDVIVEDRPQLAQRAADGIDQSLQDLAERDGIDGAQFWPFTWQQTLYENKTYGIPYETDVVVLYWNKNAFKEAGLDPEKPPKTWDEVQQYADKLDKKNASGGYDRIGFFPLIRAGAETWGYTNGVEWIGKDGKPEINTPQAAETVSWIKQWIDRYGGWPKVQEFRSQFAAPPQDEFMSGKVAMIADINGYASFLNFFRPKVPTANGESANLDWGVSDLPYKTAKGSTSGGFALSVPTGAKNKDAAWEFIKCATGQQAQASWARDTYAMPANQQAANDPVLLADPSWKFFVDAMSYSSGGTFYPAYPNWKEQLEQRYEKVWSGALAPQQALDEAQKAVEQGGNP